MLWRRRGVAKKSFLVLVALVIFLWATLATRSLPNAVQWDWDISRISSTFQKDPTAKKLKLIHILSPFVAAERSNDFYPLNLNQWAAMESIRRSLDRTSKSQSLDVEFVCAVSSSDQLELFRGNLPCQRYATLKRSTATEYSNLTPLMDLPFVSDMIEEGIGPHRSDTFHVMITNADIGLSKDFYESIARIMKKYDAFSINRMTIPLEDFKTTTNVTEVLGLLDHYLLNQGKSHPGYDLFCISSHVLERVLFGEFFLGRPPWGSNLHLMLEIMADNYINIKSSPFGTFHLGNDNSGWKNANRVIDDEQGSDSFSLRSFCPSRNLRKTDLLARQNEINCGLWFRGHGRMTGHNTTTQLALDRQATPGFVRPGFEHIFWNNYKEYLKFDAMGRPWERKFETPKRKRKADRPLTWQKAKKSRDPLQPPSV